MPCRELLSEMYWASSPDHHDWHHLVPKASDIPSVAADKARKLSALIRKQA